MAHKVFIVPPLFGADPLFLHYGHKLVSKPEKADFLVFTGGADIDPRIYGHPRHPSVYMSLDRDKYETEMYDKFVGKKPMVGICRGAQLLNALNHGTMYQDVDNHGRSRGHIMLDTRTGEKFSVSSAHHQMMKPHPDGQVIGVSYEGGNRIWWDEKAKEFKEEISKEDIESVLYPKTRSFCFQGHPEYFFFLKEWGRMRSWFLDEIEALLKAA